MCICMPAMRVILIRLLSKFLRSIKESPPKQCHSNQKYSSENCNFDQEISNSSSNGGQKRVIRRERTVITIERTFDMEQCTDHDKKLRFKMDDLEPERTKVTTTKSQSLVEISL